MAIAPKNIVSRKVMGMDIHHLREWAEFMDKAMIISLVIAALAAAAVGVTTWLSIKFNGAVRGEENEAFGHHFFSDSSDFNGLTPAFVALVRRNRKVRQFRLPICSSPGAPVDASPAPRATCDWRVECRPRSGAEFPIRRSPRAGEQ